jgi:two-component system, NarL family, response regulator DegU
MKTVVIADDHEIFRSILKRQLKTNFKVVGEARDGGSALELVQNYKPDLVILDLSMPVRSGLSIISAIKLCYDSAKILVLTIHNSAEYARSAFDFGANGYCLKDESRKALFSAISTVMKGGQYVSPYLVEEKS